MLNNKRNNGRARAVAAFAVSSALALGGIAISDVAVESAQAGDNKLMPGTACDEGFEFFFTDRTNPSYLQSDLDDQIYMCPVLRDDTTGELDRVRVNVINDTVASVVNPVCTIHSVSADASNSDSRQATAIAAGFTILDISLAGFVEFPVGHYVLECDLGENDRIISYNWRED